MHNKFKGMGIALITPFTQEGKVDFVALRRLLDYQLSNGADFLCILATTAETPTLTEEEKNQVKDLVVEKVNGSVPIITSHRKRVCSNILRLLLMLRLSVISLWCCIMCLGVLALI